MDLGASASPDIEITEGICIVFLLLLSADVNEDGGDHDDVRDVMLMMMVAMAMAMVMTMMTMMMVMVMMITILHAVVID